MVYYPRNSSRRVIDREPSRRDYYSHHAPPAKPSSSSRDDYYHHHAPSSKPAPRENYHYHHHAPPAKPAPREAYYYRHHAPSAKPASWEDNRYSRRGKYDKLPGEYFGCRRNYGTSSAPNRRLHGNVHNYKHCQSSSSMIRRPNYGVERDRNDRKYQIPVRRYNQKRPFPPSNRVGGNYHGQKMHHRRIFKTYRNQTWSRRTDATGKYHSPELLPPPPPLPESEFMLPDLNASPVLSSPVYSEEEGELRSCSPVLEECYSDFDADILEEELSTADFVALNAADFV